MLVSRVVIRFLIGNQKSGGIVSSVALPSKGFLLSYRIFMFGNEKNHFLALFSHSKINVKCSNFQVMKIFINFKNFVDLQIRETGNYQGNDKMGGKPISLE